MQNKMSDMHNILMQELERLNDESLTGDALKEEIERSKAISSVAQSAINNGNLALSTAKFLDDQLSERPLVPSFMAEDTKRLEV